MNVPSQHSWAGKFRNAFRGLGSGVRDNNSFFVHLPATAGVLALATWLQVSSIECCVLLLCIAVVLAAELFNSALEELAREVDSNFNPGIGRALDIASGAVLVAAIGATVIGCIIFWPYLAVLV